MRATAAAAAAGRRLRCWRRSGA